MGRAGMRLWAPCLVSVLVPGVASAADMQVGPGGDLQAAIDQAQPGDTITVMPGTYPGPLQTANDGQDGAPITIVGDPAGEAIVQSDGTALSIDHDWHVFEGLVFDGAYGGGDGIQGGGSDLVLRNVEVRRFAQDCIDLADSGRVLISASRIHHCVAGEVVDAHGVTGNSVFGLRIEDTEIAYVSGDSVQLSDANVPWDDLTIERCTLWTGPLDVESNGVPAGAQIGENALDTKTRGGNNPTVTLVDVVAFGWHDHPGFSNAAAWNLKENVNVTMDRVTTFDSQIAFRLRGPDISIRVHNSVVYDVDRAYRLEDDIDGFDLRHTTVGRDVNQAFQIAGGAMNTSVRGSLFWGTLPDEAMGEPTNLGVDDTVFVDAPGHDYHLVPGAMPIDRGAASPEVPTDRDCVPRPQGTEADIGAYEWTDDPNAASCAVVPPDPTTGGSDDGGGDGTGGGDGAGTGGDGSTAGDGSSAGADGSGGGSGSDSGCGCRADSTPSLGWFIGVALLGAARRRR